MDYRKEKIIIFDGVCNLCEQSVLFVIKHDKQKQFKFCSAQSNIGLYLQETYKVDAIKADTVILILNGVVFKRSDAVLMIISHFGGYWRLMSVFKYIPFCIRDFCYKKLAKHRYLLFGKKSQCLIPSDNISKWFL